MVAVAVVSEQAVRHDGTVSVAAFSFATKRCVTISSCVCEGVDSVSGTPLNEPSTILVRRPPGPPQFIMVFFMSVTEQEVNTGSAGRCVGPNYVRVAVEVHPTLYTFPSASPTMS